MHKRFYIVDWAGNDKSDYYGEFKSFDAAISRLYSEFEHLSDNEFEARIGEFEIRVKEKYQ